MTARRAGERTVLPLFPLGTVLVPGLVLPLHVFEPRYRRLVQDLAARPEDERGFGVVAIREGHEVGEHGVRALHDVGTLALVRSVTPYDDGRSDLTTNGDARFRLLRLVETDAPYHCAEVEWLAEVDGERTPELARQVVARFEEYRVAMAGAGAVEAAQMAAIAESPRTLAYLVSAAMVLDLRERQLLLEAPTTEERLRLALSYLARETTMMRELPSLPAVDLARTAVSTN